MSYLDDYLDLIEDLPQEIRDQFMEMRGLDIIIEHNMTVLERRAQNLFAKCQISGVTANSDSEYQSIRQDYGRTLEDADDKVNLASQMCELADRNLRHLDAEIHKLKCKLEIDKEGSTELLEKRSLELDTPSTTHQKQNKFKSRSGKGQNNKMSEQVSKGKQKPTMLAKTIVDGTAQTMSSSTLDHTGAENAVTAATSQAKPAAGHVQKSKKRIANKKASNKTASTEVPVNKSEIGQELASAVHTAVKSTEQATTTIDKKKKKKASTTFTAA